MLIDCMYFLILPSVCSVRHSRKHLRFHTLPISPPTGMVIITNWLFLPVQSTLLNLSLSDATFVKFLKTVIPLGGSVFALWWNDITESSLKGGWRV